MESNFVRDFNLFAERYLLLDGSELDTIKELILKIAENESGGFALEGIKTLIDMMNVAKNSGYLRNRFYVMSEEEVTSCITVEQFLTKFERNLSNY